MIRHEIWDAIEAGMIASQEKGETDYQLPIEELQHLMRIARAADDWVSGDSASPGWINRLNALVKAVRTCE